MPAKKTPRKQMPPSKRTVARKAAARKAPRRAAAQRTAAGTAAAADSAVPAENSRDEAKLLRDSFTIPRGEYEVLASLKRRAVGLERPAKKSELLRAGIKALAQLSDEAFLAAVAAVPSIRTGRPKGRKRG